MIDVTKAIRLVGIGCALAGTLALHISATACQQEHRVAGKSSGDVFPDARIRALADAACIGDAQEVRRLVAAGTPPNGRGFEDTTVLMWAMSCENAAGLESLLAAGADPNLGANGYFPVSLASTFRKSDVLRILLKHGGNPNLPPLGTLPETWRNIDPPLWYALGASMHHDNMENLRLLLEAGADVNQGRSGGKSHSVISSAAAFNRPEEAALMLDFGYRGDLDELQSFAQSSLDNPSIIEEIKPRLRAFIERVELEKRKRAAAD